MDDINKEGERERGREGAELEISLGEYLCAGGVRDQYLTNR